MTDFANKTCAEFSQVLASKEPVPGGGGAAALVGALGAALAAMVSNLTVGKKKYAEYEEEVKGILQKAEDLRKQLLELMDKDAEAFECLMKAYSISKDVPDRADSIEKELRYACTAPMDIMRAATEIAQLLHTLAEKGNTTAISDVGCAAACCKAAVESAGLSVYINTKSMKDRDCAAAIEKETDELMTRCTALSDEAYGIVLGKLR